MRLDEDGASLLTNLFWNSIPSKNSTGLGLGGGELQDGS